MSQPDLDRLTTLLTDAGYEFEVSGERLNYVVSVEIPTEDEQLPEELQPFAWKDHEVHRAMDKGNSDKHTFNGANFELALREYASNLMHHDPETVALEATLETVTNRVALDAYQANRQAIWNRICSDPKIVAWEAHLDTLL